MVALPPAAAAQQPAAAPPRWCRCTSFAPLLLRIPCLPSFPSLSSAAFHLTLLRVSMLPLTL